MRIAQIPPLYEAVPPRLYGGTERIVGHLTEALVSLGHEVTLFAAADAQTRARLIPVRDQSIRLDPAPLKSDVAAHLHQLAVVRAHVEEFDVLHFHGELLHLPLFEDVADRTVTTQHGRLDIKDLPEAYQRWFRYPLVSISNNQRTPLPDANWIATVPHGLPSDLHAFTPRGSGDYLAFLGRLSPEKGVERAIAIAKRSGVPLKIAAKIDDTNAVYYREVIQPLLTDSLVEYVGEIGDADKGEFLGNALALLFPIDWPEPFGLVMIEAMACGTPVITFERGSVPEVIEEGVSGLIVNDDDAAVAAVPIAASLDRRRVRQAFERRFTVMTMAKNYLAVYERLAKRQATATPLLETA
jgi:glycosyltransferase involved in cell wall biosynthesis